MPRSPPLNCRRENFRTPAAATADVSGSSSAGGDEHGFILIAVLAVLALMGLVAFLITRDVSIGIRLAGYNIRRAEAESLADGAARLAIRHLSANPPAEGRSGTLRLDGTPAACRLGDGVATVSLADADGLVNINLATPELLERLIAGIVATRSDASRLAQAIVDFRSDGDSAAGGGSKLAAYELAGLAHGPKMAPFETVAELDQVIGMTPELRERLKPMLTVRSRFATVNVKLATPEVLAALAGDGRAPPTDAVSIAALRDSISLPEQLTFVPRTRSTQATASKSIHIRVGVGAAGGGRFIRHAVAELGSGPQSSAALREWSESADLGYATPAAADGLPLCIGGFFALEAK